MSHANRESWTYGVEHEFADWDTLVPLPPGCSRSPDYTIVNTNGIAAQPNPKVYRFGGEINTPPTKTPSKQIVVLQQILKSHPNCRVNYRSNLHIHIRVPGLAESLSKLKQLQKFIHTELPKVIQQLEPIPGGTTKAEKKRARRRKVSHQTFLSEKRLKHQLSATSLLEFFELEVPKTKAGKVMWHAQPRLAVNLRQLLQTDTIEFRHFPGTICSEELLNAICWCSGFLAYAFEGKSVESLWLTYSEKKLPKFPEFDFDTEVKYQATASHNSLKKPQIQENILLILQGKFDGSITQKEAIAKAQGVSCLSR